MRRQRDWSRMVVWAALPALVLLLGSAVPRQTIADSRPVPSLGEAVLAAPNAGWEEVGAGSATGSGISKDEGGSSPVIAIAPDGTAYVVWWGWDGDGEVYIRRWNGSAWIEVGAGSATGGGVSNNDLDSTAPSLAITPDGTPYLAWDDYDESDHCRHIYARRWNGSAWVQVGAGAVSADLSCADGQAGSNTPTLAVAPDGTPYVVWRYWDDNCSSIYVRRWNGDAWVDVGTDSLGCGGLSELSSVGVPKVAMAPDGTPYVTWDESRSMEWTGEIYILHWSGSTWEQVGAGSDTGGGISNSGRHSRSPSIAIAPDGTPYVAWVDSSGDDTEIYVRRWNGSAWVEVGAGSASGGGISNDDIESCCHSMTFTPDGTLYVAWRKGEDLDGEIYVRRWIAGAWTEAGAGSASGGGVSDNPSNSGSPSLVIDPRERLWVAWGDDGDGNYEIYVRRWSPDSLLWLPLVYKE